MNIVPLMLTLVVWLSVMAQPEISAASDVLQTVVLTGDTAPVANAGVIFSSFGTPIT
jgi:hypothetical protein